MGENSNYTIPLDIEYLLNFERPKIIHHQRQIEPRSAQNRYGQRSTRGTRHFHDKGVSTAMSNNQKNHNKNKFQATIHMQFKQQINNDLDFDLQAPKNPFKLAKETFLEQIDAEQKFGTNPQHQSRN